MNLILKHNKSAGFTIIEVMLVSGLLAIMMLGVLSISRISSKQQLQSTSTSSADMLRRNFSAYIENKNSWTNTINDPLNASLTCLRNGTSCTAQGGPILRIRDAANNIVYDASVATTGFTSAGAACNTYQAAGNDSCPLRINFTWAPICAGTCIGPQIQITGTMVHRAFTQDRNIAFNSANYSISLIRAGGGPGPAVCVGGAWYAIGGDPRFGTFICPLGGVMKGFRSYGCDPDNSPSDYCFNVYCCDE